MSTYLLTGKRVSPTFRRVPLNYQRIRDRRQRLGLSQQQAADRAQMQSRQQWNNIETGNHTNISIELLERIATALKMKPRDLLR